MAVAEERGASIAMGLHEERDHVSRSIGERGAAKFGCWRESAEVR